MTKQTKTTPKDYDRWSGKTPVKVVKPTAKNSSKTVKK